MSENTFILDLIERLRLRAGMKLLAWALAVLPASWQRAAITRDLGEQREYERYSGYTSLLGGAVLPFCVWRSEWAGMIRLCNVKTPAQRKYRGSLAVVRKNGRVA